MNIDTSSKVSATTRTTSSTQSKSSSSTGFADELSSMSAQKSDEAKDSKKTSETDKKNDNKPEGVKEGTDKEENQAINQVANSEEIESPDDMNEVIDGLEGVVVAINNKLNQTDEKWAEEFQNDKEFADTINNPNFSVGLNSQDPNAALAFQMNSGLNFNNENQQKQPNSEKKVTALVQNLADESTTVAELNDSQAGDEVEEDVRVKTVTNSTSIKKVDTKSNITVETVASFDDIAMSKNDVDFFAKLVENGQNSISTKETAEATQISKTLADMLAKSMNDNKPIRINFDNDISVIIKVGKDGKISADFLPSSQIAEAYLKENLPLLRQKFEDNNIDYEELNHREQKQNEKDENQKKGRKDE